MNFLKEFKEQFPLLSWADIIQLASAVSIEIAGEDSGRTAVRWVLAKWLQWNRRHCGCAQ